MRFLALGLVVLALAGCSSSDRLYPLHVGSSWTYTVRNGMGEFPQTVRVTRSAPVAGGQGWELSTPMGVSRLRWKDGVLVASTLANLRANPPLPLLIASGGEASQKWKGRIYASGRTEEATATLSQKRETVRRRSTEIKATKTTLEIEAGTRTIVVETTYAPNIGPITQTQRIREAGQETFVVSIEHVTGP